MPADWRPAAIPLTGGLVTSRPSQSLGPGEFTQLDNATFDDDGAPRKRHGSTAETVNYAAATGMPTDPEWVYGYGWAPGTHVLDTPPNGRTGAVRGLMTRNSDLVVYDGTRMNVRAPSLPLGWSPVPLGATAHPDLGTSTPGNVHIPHVSTRHILGSDDVDTDSGFRACKAGVVGDVMELYARVDTDSAEVYLYANELSTGSAVLDRFEQTLTAAGTSQIDVLLGYIPPATGATYGVFVMSQCNRTSGNLVAAWANEYDPTTWTTTALSAPGAAISQAMRFDSDYVYLAWSSASGATDVVTLEVFDRFGTRTTYGLGTYTGILALDIAVHPDGRLLLAYVNASASPVVEYRYFDSSFAATSAILSTDTNSETRIDRVTCEWSLLSARDLSLESPVFIAWDGVITARRILAWQLVTEVAASFTQGEVISGADQPYTELAATAFRVGDTVFLPCRYRSTASQDQNVLFYYEPQARRETSGIEANHTLVPCASWSRGSVEFTPLAASGYEILQCPRVVGSVATWPCVSRRPAGVNRSFRCVTVNADAQLRSVQAGASTYTAGGVVREYDGRTLHEAGFLDVPKPILTPDVQIDPGNLTAGIYTYRLYLVHLNAAGEETRSAAITQTVEISGLNDRVAIVLPPMPLCTRPGARWEIYRSQKDGTVLTRSSFSTYPGDVPYDSWPVSRNYDTTFPTAVVLHDAGVDADIADNAIDPVPFGVLDNVSPPACEVIAQGKDRVWYAGGDLLPGQAAYSKFWDPGDTPGWNEALVVETDRVSPVQGLGFLGDWFVAMSSGSLYQFAGDGPSNLGLGDFTPGRLISTDVGCVAPDSVVLTPLGIAFQSQKGIRVLGHGGALLSGRGGLLGSEVDGSFAQTVVGSCAVPNQDHARWILADGTMMVWDYSTNKWARWTGFQLSPYGTPNALRTLNGAMVVAEADQILLEDTALATDGGRPYRFIASMGWMAPHGMLNWGRLRRWSLEGSALGPFTAQVYIDYDFKDGTRRQSYTWAASTSRAGADGATYDHDPGSWGSEGTWGGGIWGGDTADGGAFPVNVRFNRQKATSFRFTITDSGEPNLTLALRVLAIEFSPMAGLVRIGGRNI